MKMIRHRHECSGERVVAQCAAPPPFFRNDISRAWRAEWATACKMDIFPMRADRHEIHPAAGVIVVLKAYGSAVMPRGIVTRFVFVGVFHAVFHSGNSVPSFSVVVVSWLASYNNGKRSWSRAVAGFGGVMCALLPLARIICARQGGSGLV